MKRRIRRILIRILLLALATALWAPPIAPGRGAREGEDRHPDSIRRQGPEGEEPDRLKSGDMLRIYVHPEHASYVYVIHSDGQTATLLNTVEQKVQASTLVMPSLHQFYQVDGKSPKESFTIICSPRELAEVSQAFDMGQAPHSAWASVEEDLTSRSRIDLTQGSDRPFAIAGNVRGGGGGGSAGGDPFSSRLQIFSGRSLLVKHYAFQVR